MAVEDCSGSAETRSSQSICIKTSVAAAAATESVILLEESSTSLRVGDAKCYGV